MKKRILSIVLSIVMLVSLLPTTALAADGENLKLAETPYEAKWGESADSLTESGTLADAVAEAATDSSITYIQLQSGVTLGESLTVTGGNFTLDLNGQTVSGTVSHLFDIEGGTVTIDDTSDNGKISGASGSTAVYISGGTLNLVGGRLESISADSNATAIYISGSSTVNISGGEVYAENTNTNSPYPEAVSINSGNSSLTVSGGSIAAKAPNAESSHAFGIRAYQARTLSITGGSISATVEGRANNSWATGIYVGYDNAIENFMFSDGSISASGGERTGGIAFYGDQALTISGGLITLSNAGSYKGAVYSWNQSPVITVVNNAAFSDSDNFTDFYIYGGSGVKVNLSYTTSPSTAPTTPYKIYISPTAERDFTSGWSSLNVADTEIDNYFTAPGSNQKIIKNTTTNELRLVEAYTITFSTGGYGTAPDSQKLLSGEKVTKPEDPVREGYGLNHWCTKYGCSNGTTCENSWDFDNDTVTASDTLYAAWERTHWEVYLNLQGGDCDIDYAYADKLTGKLASLPEATRVGYIFNGWFSAREGGNEITTETEFSSNTTIYAQWTAYAITQQPTADNEYEVIVNPSAGVTYTWHEITETAVTTENADVYEDEGCSSSYTDGWWSYHSTEGMGTPGYFSIDLNAGDTVEVELSRNCEGTVRIQYFNEETYDRYQAYENTNGGNKASLVAPAAAKYDLYVSVWDGSEQPTVKAKVINAGEAISGQITNKLTDGTDGTKYAAKITYPDGAVLTSEAVCYVSPTFKVTFCANGGTINSGNITSYTKGVGAALPTNVTKEGYNFGGWYEDENFTGNAVTRIESTDTGDKEYFAKWNLNAPTFSAAWPHSGKYDGAAHEIGVTFVTENSFECTYQWYKDGKDEANKVDGAMSNTYSVKDAADSGTYYCKVTATDGAQTQTAWSPGITVSIAKRNVTLTSASDNKEFDGTALTSDGITVGGDGFVFGEGASYTVTGSQTNAGSSGNTFTYMLNEGTKAENYNITKNEGTLTIDPMAVDEPTVSGTYTYTGSEQTVKLNGYDSSYMTIAGNKGTNAGGYEAVITLDSNHAWKSGSDGKVQWSIEPATPDVTWPTATAYVNDEKVTLTGGSAAGVGTEISVAGSFALDTVDLTSAGTKTVKITFTPASTNYGGVVKMEYSVTVSKRIVESTAEQTPITNAVYGTDQNALGLPTSVEITVSGNKKFTVPVEWSGYDKTNLNAQTLTGTLDLTKIAGEVQQADPAITASIVVDLQEKNAAEFSFENKTVTYNGAPITHEISGELEGVASISYSYEGTDGTEYEASAAAPTSAGTYEVTAFFTMQPGYAAVVSKTATLTINPKEVVLAWSELTAAELVYSGTAKTLTATATGLVDGDSCTVTVELVGDNINVGTFSYEATALSNENYKLPTEVSSPEYTITPKTLTITAEDKEAYVGSRQFELTYTVDGLVGNDTLTTVPTLTTDANMYRAGTYAITFDTLASAGDNYAINYVDGTLTVKNYPYISQPTYDVEIADDITGGEVSASKKLAYSGDTIMITVAPNAGYELTKLTVTDSRGNAVAVIRISDSKYTFKMPGYDVEIDAEFAKIDTTCPGDHTCPMYPYIDLDTGLWYHDGIHYCIEHGLMVGTGTNIFEPNIATSRAMIVTILWRLESSPVVNYAMDFEDVAADQWYTEAIRWAASEKIVEGYGNGKFGTNDAITREQMVTIMFRYSKYKGYDVSVGENTNILSYDDAFDVADWAIPAMQWACGSGMIQGIADGNQMNLAPQGNATRAQAAAILQRFGKNVANKE